MDRLRRDEIEATRMTPLEEKARRALELMRMGIRLKRAALETRHPDATAGEIEAMLQAWLDADDDD